MTQANVSPDPWQERLLRSRRKRLLLLAGRQCGKTLGSAGLALREALLRPTLILLLSPTLRQSGELFRDKFLLLYHPWRKVMPPNRETQLTIELANGSRVVSLPGSEDGIVGYSSVGMLLIDEAAKVTDSLYRSVRPMLAVSSGRLICLSTPFGKRGFFWEEWESTHNWERTLVRADQCPRIAPEFLEEERQSLGDRWFRQEYLCSFEETVDAVFSSADIEAACQAGIEHNLKALKL